jgi:hypothetical protein
LSDHCCDMMESNLRDGETAIRYYPKFREYGILVLDGGSSFVQIRHCPWCGKPLPASLRNEWFEIIEAKGLEPEDAAIPQEMTSDAWWKIPS